MMLELFENSSIKLDPAFLKIMHTNALLSKRPSLIDK